MSCPCVNGVRVQENMLIDQDRARFFYWNLFSIALTALPLIYLSRVRTIRKNDGHYVSP